MITLRELKARKAKYGFHYGHINLGGVVQLGKFIEELELNYQGRYMAEEAGYNQPELKIYTDEDDVAHWIRQNSNLYT